MLNRQTRRSLRANGLQLLPAAPFKKVYGPVGVEGFPDAFTPELWARESLPILEENMVMGNLVHRDFSDDVAEFGDVVNTRKPGEFKAKRKTSDDSVTVQSATATSIPVTLNQHLHTSFMIKDKDQSLAFEDLTAKYLQPAMLSIAQGIDKVLSTQVYQFLRYGAGSLNALDKTNAQQYLTETRQAMNLNKAYQTGRNLILSPVSETLLLQDPAFTQAYSVGDEGTAMREASLGRKFGFDIFMAQNQPYVSTAMDKRPGAINNAAGYPAGTTSFTVDGITGAVSNGTWISIVGDGSPLQVGGSSGGGTPTALTTKQGTRRAVVDNAVITIGGVGAVNNSGGYVNGWVKEIVFDGFTLDPQIGQGVSFGNSTTLYGIIDVDTVANTITLDRPLEGSLSDDDTINLLPPGSYNFAFHRNAIALVSRPLARPMPGTGALAGVASYNNISMRVTMTYDGNKQGMLTTVDTLIGVATLEQLLGAVMAG